MVGLVRVFSKGRERRSGEIVTRWIRRGNTKGEDRYGGGCSSLDIFCLAVPRRRDFYCVNATSRAVAFSSHFEPVNESIRHLVCRPIFESFSFDRWFSRSLRNASSWTMLINESRWKLSVHVRVLGREFAEETNAVSDRDSLLLSCGVEGGALRSREKNIAGWTRYSLEL